MTDTLSALAILFAAAFGAATLLPFQSEIVLGALYFRQDAPVWALLCVASVGNTLGSVLNWVIGRWIEHFRHSRWFPVSDTQLERAQEWYIRWGLWSLLISWAPFGDAVTVVAGIMRCPLWAFVVIVGAVKTLRYAIVLWGLAAV
ncbi:YqaA family protein [Oceanibium sediminis]|uniref:YqaA family protein n=1 Tax=Oceanibium sediminis TaxID=2026339 RepID=UPI000DD2C8BC|nr:YqaA family protein [Oceanibium sediminis]